MAREANHIPIIRDAVERAGGVEAVAAACQCTTRSVYNWMRHGMPYTDLTGKTQYAQIIAKKSGMRMQAILSAKPEQALTQ